MTLSFARTALRGGAAGLLLAVLAACSGGGQQLDAPPPPDPIESLDDLPGGMGATNEEPDSPPDPE